MTQTPAVLLLDDGELDRVEAILRELDVDYLRLKGREVGRVVEAPSQLLVTSGRRALNEMPAVEAPAGDAPAFTWVCLHNQDFLPLRQRLREMGVHFLVQAALDQESLRLFLSQLFYRGVERRGYRRLPLGGELMYRVESEDHRAKLLELFQDGCRIRTSERLGVDQELSVFLPPALSGGDQLELRCRVIRRDDAPGAPQGSAWSVVLRFEALGPEARVALEMLATGNQIGTRLTPLSEPVRPAAAPPLVKVPRPAPSTPLEAEPELQLAEPEPGPEPELDLAPELSAEQAERRLEQRVRYPQRVQAFTGDGAPRTGLGRDLSSEGIFIEGETQLVEGDAVTLALHTGDSRAEPILVDARVVRHDGERGVALCFESLSPDQRFQLDKLAAQLPPLRGLDDDSNRIVSEVVRRER